MDERLAPWPSVKFSREMPPGMPIMYLCGDNVMLLDHARWPNMAPADRRAALETLRVAGEGGTPNGWGLMGVFAPEAAMHSNPWRALREAPDEFWAWVLSLQPPSKRRGRYAS